MNLKMGAAVLVVTAMSLLTVVAIFPRGDYSEPEVVRPEPKLSTGGRLSKEFDPEYGVVCYWNDTYKSRQLSCLQVAPTAADLDLEDAPEEGVAEDAKYVF